MFERDAYCGACGEKIDTIRGPNKRPNGFAEALLLDPMRQKHQEETGCQGSGPHCRGWTFGPWRKVVV